MRKRYQIFVSSTYADLVEERHKVMETILNFDCFPAGMELIPAMDEAQYEYIKRIIDESDYYLLIIGGRYGSVDDKGVSWTEKEYDYAISKGIPVLVFVHRDFRMLPIGKTDLDYTKRRKLDAFKGKVSKGRLIKYWTNANDLALEVAGSLKSVIELMPRTGWVRANTFSNVSEQKFQKLQEENANQQKQLREAQEKIKFLEKELEELIVTKRLSKSKSQVEKLSFTVADVSFNMIRVKGGTFMMGAYVGDRDADSDEKPAHQVTLSDYYIGEIQVTQALWQAVMGVNPSSFKGNLNLPVENVSWYDCQIFIEKLNMLTGKSFRLPTEAQWEFAARGGNKSKNYKYAGENDLDLVAWYGINSNRKTHSVSQLAPNELGLYDMSGNVYEWCQDRFGSYSDEAQTNPQGPSSGSQRVIRGGSWFNGAGGCRISYRYYNAPSQRDNSLGLRLAI